MTRSEFERNPEAYRELVKGTSTGCSPSSRISQHYPLLPWMHGLIWVLDYTWAGVDDSQAFAEFTLNGMELSQWLCQMVKLFVDLLFDLAQLLHTQRGEVDCQGQNNTAIHGVRCLHLPRSPSASWATIFYRVMLGAVNNEVIACSGESIYL